MIARNPFRATIFGLTGPIVTDDADDPDRGRVIEFLAPHVTGALGTACDRVALANRREGVAIATTVGLPAEYGPAQRLYATRDYRPDGRGVCRGTTPLHLGDQVQLDHDLILWLVKDLSVP